MPLFLKRAALIAALSFYALSSGAQIKNTKSETYKDIIEKAYNLSLQKDRQQALIILTNAIQKELRPQNIIELKKTAAEIAHVFFSDKAQQHFESGMALRRSDLNQALDKVTEALRIEPDNFSIVSEVARLYIAKGDCKSAQEIVQKHSRFVGNDEELKLSLAQAYACQQKWAEYQKLFDPPMIKKSIYQKFWLVLEIERNVSIKNYVKAQENWVLLNKTDEKYPETFFWSWKLAAAQRREDPETAQKYLMACKNVSANQYRQYMIDPMLCRHLTDVERDQKGMNGTSE